MNTQPRSRNTPGHCLNPKSVPATERSRREKWESRNPDKIQKWKDRMDTGKWGMPYREVIASDELAKHQTLLDEGVTMFLDATEQGFRSDRQYVFIRLQWAMNAILALVPEFQPELLGELFKRLRSVAEFTEPEAFGGGL